MSIGWLQFFDKISKYSLIFISFFRTAYVWFKIQGHNIHQFNFHRTGENYCLVRLKLKLCEIISPRLIISYVEFFLYEWNRLMCIRSYRYSGCRGQMATIVQQLSCQKWFALFDQFSYHNRNQTFTEVTFNFWRNLRMF